jgi:CDP-glucose 4,6-dehydratase
MTPGFWKGKRVLITGHTGFKGSWLTFWLRSLGADVTGLALPIDTAPCLHDLLYPGPLTSTEHCDIRDAIAVSHRVTRARPEIVFHLAAQPLVRASYRDPAETWSVNVQGTLHLLDALRLAKDVKSVVIVTTDKVYDNQEARRAFVETDPLGGHDPYSASKAAAEILTASYRSSYFQGRGVGIATARAGNVIGGGDWAEDRLVPDAIRAWSKGHVLSVRNPASVRPWQHVLEPLAGYMLLAEALFFAPELGSGWNFGPDHRSAQSVGDILNLARAHYGKGDMQFHHPVFSPHEAGYLMLDSTKAQRELGYVPHFGLDETVSRTMAWYRDLETGASARDLCQTDIDAYLGIGRQPQKVAL